jgi:uncharacterized protein (DUF2384 family)
MNEVALLEEATHYIGDASKAGQWIEQPHPFLGGKTPLEIAGTAEGDELILESLMSIAYGGLG